MEENEEFEMSERVVRVNPIRLNVADFGVATVTIFRGLFEGLVGATEYLEGAFLAQSAFIAEKQEFAKINCPLPVRESRLGTEPHNSVAKGCLVAALVGDDEDGD